MAKKKEIYKVKPLNENKKNIIAALIEEYDIETADDIQDAYECQLESEPRARLILSHLCSFESEPPTHYFSNDPVDRNLRSCQEYMI